jgi:glycerol transport system ATP-binding protein
MDRFTLGVRPEYVQLAAADAPGAVPGTVTQAQDIGTYWLVTVQVGPAAAAQVLRARLSPEQTIPMAGDAVWLGIVGAHTCFYRNEELIE